KTAMKKIPQKALTKTFWYPIFKKMANSIGIKITKQTVGKGVSAAIPIVGGVISGGLNFASMLPMAKRLQNELDKTCFDYSEEEFEQDYAYIEAGNYDDEPIETVKEKTGKMIKSFGVRASKVVNKFGSGIKDFANKKQEEDPLEIITKLYEMKEANIISEDEYEEKRKDLLNRI
ncbi:MAG: SHOCT domain-containing protein, partial [Alphaproteobacteria bacterium]|nr:SHOCT domain-containing protein [Alphaproteobacteria bacterium]